MFNQYDVNNSLKINATSGTIVKNYKESFILRFHIESVMAGELFNASPKLHNSPVVVLQVMLCNENQLLAEVMYKDDFEKIYDIFKQKGGA